MGKTEYNEKAENLMWTRAWYNKMKERKERERKNRRNIERKERSS